jgi:hypothetical protein
MKDHVYRYDNIVIGGNLSSLIFVYLNGYRLIVTDLEVPLPFEMYEASRDLSSVKIKNSEKILVSPTGQVSFGMNKADLFYNLYMRLAITGKIICELPHQSLRIIKEQNLIKIVSEKSRIYNFKYKNLYSFKNIGLDFEVPLDHFDIVSNFSVTRCYKHNYEYLQKQENGIIESGVFTKYTDLITLTKVNKEQLDTHIDFYIKNYLEKYLRTLLINHPRHFVKVVGKKVIKKEVLVEQVLKQDNISLITLNDESILDGKYNQEKQQPSI